MDIGSEEQGARGLPGSRPSWIFIHDIDKVEGGLMVHFFGLFFRWSPGNFSADAFAYIIVSSSCNKST